MLTTATTLYASPVGIECHCIRMIIAEKGIQANQHIINIEDMPNDIMELNPYQMLPVLFDRKMVLYDFSVVAEYLDERFPFPPLMPVDPIERAEKRLLMFRFVRAEESLFDLANRILNPSTKKNTILAQKMLTSYLVDLTPLFEAQPFFKSDHMTIIDICMATLLWRLEKMKITLPATAKPVLLYAERLFARDAFKKSLSNLEKEYHL